VKERHEGHERKMMWTKSLQQQKKKEEKENKITDSTRNVKYVHMQISTPKIGNKTRACKVKEALMIIFATSKHIKLHPKEEGAGEIISNIDDLVTTEEATNQYFFDKKTGGKRYIRGEGAVEYYVTKVRLETDIGLNYMKWRTSTKFLEAIKAQHIFLKEFQDGKTIQTGNVGWLAGINPANTSVTRTTRDLNKVLTEIDATAIIDIHTVSIRFPETKKAFVTRAYKIMSNKDKIDEARERIQQALQNKSMGVGWDAVSIVPFNMDKNTTAMTIEKHNKILHNTAVIPIKNVWSITEKDTEITREEIKELGLDEEDKVSTIEEMWWELANKYKHDIQGMVARRGTLEILTTRMNLDETVGFARELVDNTIRVIGEKRFAKLTANHNPAMRKPTVLEAPMILAGNGRVKLDTTQFSAEEFKYFAQKHGIKVGDSDETNELNADLTRPPRAFYHKAGREPVEQDPTKMREGAMTIWEKFTEVAKKRNRTKENEVSTRQKENEAENAENIESRDSRVTPRNRSDQNISDEIKQNGRMIRLEHTIKAMTDSQEALKKSTTTCQEAITKMQKVSDDNIDKMSDIITKMGESITIQNKQLEVQAKAQAQQAEDIQKIMAAISVISEAVQITPITPDDRQDMQIDIAESNYNKRKQTSEESTTLLIDETRESTSTQPTTKSQYKGMYSAGRQ
jgi:hypothetical protein